MKFFLFLFSTGQDSSFFLFLTLLYGKTYCLVLFVLNHETQLNGKNQILQNSRVSSIFKKFSIISILDNSEFLSFTNEEILRFIRYSLQLQIGSFYNINYLGTGQTISDIYETLFFNFSLEKHEFCLLEKFQNKLLISKQYSNDSNFHILQITHFTKTKYKKKFVKDFSLFVSLKEKRTFILNRPVKHITRKTIAIFGKKQNLPIFLDLTNFNSEIMRNKTRRYLLTSLQTILIKNI
jgi:tRNA(Ile)-lysidine synthase TilS/MesJ